jgi:hypothetical protein
MRVVAFGDPIKKDPANWAAIGTARARRWSLRSTLSSALSLPYLTFLGFLSWRRRLGERRRPSHVFAGTFAGNERPLGMPAPSLPFVLCETEHPKPFSLALSVSPTRTGRRRLRYPSLPRAAATPLLSPARPLPGPPLVARLVARQAARCVRAGGGGSAAARPQGPAGQRRSR